MVESVETERRRLFLTGAGKVAQPRDATQGFGVLLKAKKPLKFRRQTPNTSCTVYNKTHLHSTTKKLVPKHPRTDEFVAQGLYAVNSFKELEAKISALESKDERGAAWEVWAEGFFVTQRQIDSHHYWPQGTEPPSLRKSLRLPRNDKGIDSVYLNQTQQYDACQCKFYIGRPTLGFGDLSTFLATALRSACQNKVVFTNCEDVVAEVRAYGVVLIRGSYLDQLTPNQLQEINDWLNQRPVIPVKEKPPREDQKEAIQKINAALDSVERAQAIAACGTGKTLVAFWVAESRAPKTTLVLVPSLALLGQFRAVWFERRKTSDFKFIDKCVCSDPRVKKDDDIPATDCDFPVSISADDVRQFLDLPTTQPKVLFCTYQSAEVLIATGHEWDLAIFDEAHKTAVKNGGLFSTGLDDTKVRIKKRIFFTATPRHYRLRQEDGEKSESEVWSMDNEDQYGKVVYDLTFPEAIRRNLICDYQALVTTFTTNEVNDWLRKHGETLVTPTSSGQDFVRACQVANQLALAKAQADYGIKKIFTFHSSVLAAESFVAPGAEGIGSHLKDFYCASIDGSMNMGRRIEIMDAFEDSPLAILSNAKCLTEGVDSPLVDCVAFLSPKEDRIGIVQAIGRAMRKVDGKKLGYVLVPLYVALAENETIEEAAIRAKFETVLEILQSLKEIDERFADEIYELVQPRARAKGHRDWKQTEHVKFVAPNVLLEKLVETIAIQCIDGLIPSWDKMYAELVAYKEVHGHCNVPQASGPLGAWCCRQRNTDVKEKLTPEQVAQLNAIGYCWDLLAAAWDKNYAELVAYKEVNGHCNVPFKNGASPLGGWCAHQRMRRKKGDITPEQVAQLEAIGFCWHLRDALWDKNYAELVAYKQVNGDCNVPQSSGLLGHWCTAQRARKATLSPERISRLDALGFCWDTLDALWDKNYTALVAFKEAHGHCNVTKDVGSLGEWCNNVRQRRKKGTLTPEQIAQLNSLGFCWNNRQARWEKSYAELVAFKEAHGHCRVPAEKSLLGSWCSVQRCSKARLTSERIARLDALGFCWDIFGTAWEKNYAELMAYKEANDDCNPPPSSSLRTWCDNMRRHRKRGELSSEQITQLDAVGFCWDLAAALWNKTYAELVAYKEAHGHCNVPQSSRPLGTWCGNLRASRRNGTLGLEKIAQLDALGFRWAQAQ